VRLRLDRCCLELKVRNEAAGDAALALRQVRVRVKIMGSQKCGIVGKYQSVLIMINTIISTRTRKRCDLCFVSSFWILELHSSTTATVPHRALLRAPRCAQAWVG
jgi:hypothetical protein